MGLSVRNSSSNDRSLPLVPVSGIAWILSSESPKGLTEFFSGDQGEELSSSRFKVSGAIPSFMDVLKLLAPDLGQLLIGEQIPCLLYYPRFLRYLIATLIMRSFSGVNLSCSSLAVNPSSTLKVDFINFRSEMMCLRIFPSCNMFFTVALSSLPLLSCLAADFLSDCTLL